MKVSRTMSIMCWESGIPRQDPMIVEEGYHNFVERHSESSMKIRKVSYLILSTYLSNGALYFPPETFALLIAKAFPHQMACLLRRALVTGSIDQAFVGKLAIPSLETPVVAGFDLEVCYW